MRLGGGGGGGDLLLALGESGISNSRGDLRVNLYRARKWTGIGFFSILCKIYKIGDLTCSVYVVPPDIVYG